RTRASWPSRYWILTLIGSSSPFSSLPQLSASGQAGLEHSKWEMPIK
ncbi:17724_t:CDS:2, partial [Funneliformis geosporum]